MIVKICIDILLLMLLLCYFKALECPSKSRQMFIVRFAHMKNSNHIAYDK